MMSSDGVPPYTGLTEPWVAIVDDDEAIRRSIARLFLLDGIATRTFASAEAYLARSPRDVPSCLVLDVDLGGMSGFAMYDRLQLEGDATPVVFVTAMEGIPTTELERRVGTEGYLRKPFAADALLALVRPHVVRAPAAETRP